MTRRLSKLVRELPKSILPASAAADGGQYVFYVSGPTPLLCDDPCREGEALILSTGGNAAVHYGKGQFSYSTDCWALEPRHENVDGRFLYYFLTSQIDRIGALGFEGSGLQHLRKTFIREYPVPDFSRQEQTVISNVLLTFDCVIEQTEALIAKQKRIKTGLIQELLTRGIDDHGNLRSEQTHNFKDSPLGRIPVEWEVRELQSLLANIDSPMRSGPFGSALLKEELVESGVPLLGIDNVFPERFKPDFRRFVSPKKAAQLHRFRVRPRDLMITIMGTVGHCCVVPENIGEALSSKHVWTLSMNQDLYSPFLACLQINHSPWVIDHFARDEQGGIMASIRSETLRTTRLPTPPPPEMLRIERVLRASAEDLRQTENMLVKIALLKTGLMQDLLTGNCRVTALLERCNGGITT